VVRGVKKKYNWNTMITKSKFNLGKLNRQYLFIDGSNLYAEQYDLFGPHEFINFPIFIRQIENKLEVKFNRIFFYTSYSPQAKKPTRQQKLYLKNEAFFYRSVKNTERVTFFTGYRSKTSGKEKEVDVKLAVDMVNFAHLNKYDTLYLFSGDADFMHALVIAKQLRKKVVILALQNRIPIRFTYNYQTYAMIIDKIKEKPKCFPKQKITFITIPKEKIILRV